MDLPCAWCSFAGQFDPPSPSTHKYTYVIIIFYHFRTFTFDPFLQVRRGIHFFMILLGCWRASTWIDQVKLRRTLL